MSRIVRYAMAAAALAPAGAMAQKSVVLSKPEAEYTEPFTAISGVRELSDGRVIVADARDKTLQLINLKTGSATNVGREGQGPGEFALPFRVVAFPGDTSALYDIGNSRYLTILPDGKTGGEFRLEARTPARPEPAQGGGGRVMLGGGRSMMTITPPRATDAQGNIYYEGSPFTMGPDGPVSSDSVAVLRFDRRAARIDTVAYTRVAKSTTQVSGSAGNVRMSIGGGNPITPRDDWAVFPDGRVAVLRSPEYRMDVYGPKGVKAGTPVPYDKIRVDDAVKKDVEDQRKKQMSGGIQMMVTNDGSGPKRSVSMGGAAGGPRMELPPITDWPDYMPPFLSNAATGRPNGEIWVLRARRPGDEVPVYDVFDASARVIGHVTLPAKARLVGFGKNSVYLIRLDADDLQYLQRYRVASDIKLNGDGED